MILFVMGDIKAYGEIIITGIKEEPSFFAEYNILSILAILISVGAIGFSYLSLFKNKKLEIKLQKFDRICLTNIEKLFSETDVIFNKTNQPIGPFRNDIIKTFVEIQFFLISVKEKLYPDIEMKIFIDTIEEFTDDVFSSNQLTVMEFKSQYLSTKIDIFQKLYCFASASEFNPFKKKL